MEISEDQNTITTDNGVVHNVDSDHNSDLCIDCSLYGYGECFSTPCSAGERLDGKDVHFVTLNEVKND